eukprot:4705060-Amphidinium_carterae.2
MKTKFLEFKHNRIQLLLYRFASARKDVHVVDIGADDDLVEIRGRLPNSLVAEKQRPTEPHRQPLKDSKMTHWDPLVHLHL